MTSISTGISGPEKLIVQTLLNQVIKGTILLET